MGDDTLWCCYIDEGLEENCGQPAEWVIWDGVEPAYDHEVHACTEHVGELLTDSKEVHQVYPVAWVPRMEAA